MFPCFFDRFVCSCGTLLVRRDFAVWFHRTSVTHQLLWLSMILPVSSSLITDDAQLLLSVPRRLCFCLIWFIIDWVCTKQHKQHTEIQKYKYIDCCTHCSILLGELEVETFIGSIRKNPEKIIVAIKSALHSVAEIHLIISHDCFFLSLLDYCSNYVAVIKRTVALLRIVLLCS